MTPYSIPVFLGNAGIGLPHGMMPPQIRGFDVYYRLPVEVGFHVVGGERPCNLPNFEFIVQPNIAENSPKIIGLYAIGVSDPVLPEFEFIAQSGFEAYSAPVLGFYVGELETADIPPEFLAQLLEEKNDPKIVGFFARSVT